MTVVETAELTASTVERERSHEVACEAWPECPGCPFDNIALCGADLTHAHICPADFSCGCVPCPECDRVFDQLWPEEG